MNASKTDASRPRHGVLSNVGYLLRLSWEKSRSVPALCVAQAALTVIASVLGLVMAPAVLEKVESAAPLSQLLLTIAGYALALMLAGGLAAYVDENVIFGRVALRMEIASRIHDKFCMTAYPRTEDAEVLDRLERARQTINGNVDATEAVWVTLKDLLASAAGFAIYLILIASLDPALVLIALLTSAASYLCTRGINLWGYRHREEEAALDHRLFYVSQKATDYRIAKDIRIFGMKGWLEAVYDKALRLLGDFYARAQRAYFWADVIDLAFTLMRNGAAYAYLIAMTLSQGLSAAQFLLYFTAVGGFTARVTSILGNLATLRRQSAELSLTREFLDAEERFRFEEGEALEPDPEKAYEIELRDVSFHYPGAAADTLRHINLRIRPGEKLAMVGLNGAGKTTLIKLICGLYDATQGEVLLDGMNIKRYNRRDYYRHFSAVFQDFSVLAATVAANVAQAEEGIDLDRVNRCLEMAGLKEKVDSLPGGVATPIGREVYEDAPDFSGGEMQRLMLARALYKNAPFIVLDEPTAALDPIAESDLYQRYNELTRGRTSVYISHRLASTRFCDRILLIENGVIAQEGTHEELLRQEGTYAHLFAVQSRYYRKGGEAREA